MVNGFDIELGDKVRDKYSGFVGIAVGKTEFINGCIQYIVQAKMKKGENLLPSDSQIGIDSNSLEVIEPKIKKIKKKRTGGPNTYGLRMRGY